MKALVTGASSGIGKEIARYLAGKGYDLILVAKNADRLQTAAAEIKGVSVRTIASDLAQEQNVFELYEAVKDEQIDFLVNNAGFGAYGKFAEVPLETELALIRTNVTAVHILTKLFLSDMLARDSGCILNVGSAAGFLAGPTFSSYYASKNYVVRLTEAIHEELRRDGSNVKISVLCPGPVKTNFNNVANVRFCLKGLDAAEVARCAVDQTLKGKMVITPGLTMKCAKLLQHLAGEELLTRISYNVQSKKGEQPSKGKKGQDGAAQS